MAALYRKMLINLLCNTQWAITSLMSATLSDPQVALQT